MSSIVWFVVGLIWLLAVLWFRWRRTSGATTSTFDLDLVSAGVLLLATVAFFWRTLSGDVYQPADGGDLVSFLFPTYRFAARQLAHGALPLWNPHLYGGAPFISDIQAGFLYLPNFLLFLAQPAFPYVTLQWLAVGHLYWAGLGMYVLLRVLRWNGSSVSRPAALFAALAFQFSDPFLTHLGNLNLIAVLSWLPWVFVAYTRALAGRSYAWAAVAGFLLALAGYAGHAQSSMYIGLALIVFTLLWMWNDRSGDHMSQGWTARMRPLLLLGLVVVLALLLSAPILLPAMELSGYTERSDFTYQDTVAYSLAPTQAIGLLTPGFFGRGPALHWSLWDRVETPYAGVIALLLAIGAVLVAGDVVRRQLWPWIGVAIFGFLTALGVYAILHGWLTVVIPGFAQFRAPARALILWVFGIAVVSAVGLDAIARSVAGSDRIGSGVKLVTAQDAQFSRFFAFLRYGALILFGVVIPLMYLALLLTQENETAFLRASVAALAMLLAGGFWLATWAVVAGYRVGWWSATVFAVLMLGLLFVDLSATGAYTDISATDPTQGYNHPEIVAFLKQDSDLYRIDTRTGIEGLWQPDTAALHSLHDVGGIANPLELRHWNRLWEVIGDRQTNHYNMLNTKYVLVQDGTPLPTGKFELALDAPGALSVFRNTEFRPRAWLAHDALRVPDLDAAIAAIQEPDFDPDQTVVLSGVVQESGVVEEQALEGAIGTVDVGSYGSGYMSLDVGTVKPAYLVLSEVWYPGWQATINGVAAEIEPANGGLRAISVPAGASTVELRFIPQSWIWGVIAAGLGLLLSGLVFGYVWYAARQ